MCIRMSISLNPDQIQERESGENQCKHNKACVIGKDPALPCMRKRHILVSPQSKHKTLCKAYCSSLAHNFGIKYNNDLNHAVLAKLFAYANHLFTAFYKLFMSRERSIKSATLHKVALVAVSKDNLTPNALRLLRCCNIQQLSNGS